MFITKNKLEEIAGRGELWYKVEIEKTVEQVITSYFNIVQQQKLLVATGIIIDIDSERVHLRRRGLTWVRVPALICSRQKLT